MRVQRTVPRGRTHVAWGRAFRPRGARAIVGACDGGRPGHRTGWPVAGLGRVPGLDPKFCL